MISYGAYLLRPRKMLKLKHDKQEAFKNKLEKEMRSENIFAQRLKNYKIPSNGNSLYASAFIKLN